MMKILQHCVVCIYIIITAKEVLFKTTYKLCSELKGTKQIFIYARYWHWSTKRNSGWELYSKIVDVDVGNNTQVQQHHITFYEHWYSLSKSVGSISHWKLYVCIKQIKLFQPFYLRFTLYFFILQPKLLPFTFWGFST